jgi:arylsulfatase A-like enzyme
VEAEFDQAGILAHMGSNQVKPRRIGRFVGPGIRRTDRCAFARSVGGVWFGIALASMPFSTGCGADDRPAAVVLIVVDTLRADALAYAGGSVPTPTLDALARQGRAAAFAVGSFHMTPMSMGALFTGRTPSLETGDPASPLKLTGRTWCGLARLARSHTRSTCIPSAVPTLGELLRDVGYWTIGIASNNLIFAPFGIERGFDDWTEVGLSFTPKDRRTRQIRAEMQQSRSAQHVNRAALAALDRRPSDRVFLFVHYMDVHDNTQNRYTYSASVQKVDQAIGELMGALQNAQLLDDALVVITSDHGERLSERHFVRGKRSHGGNPSFEEVLLVPLIVIPGSKLSEGIVRGEDVFRLVWSSVGGGPPEGGELEGGELFVSERHWQTYRKGRWKSYVRRSDGRLYLVELDRDPGEKKDVADEYPDVVAAHRARVATLTTRLATANPQVDDLTEEDRLRLHALGYLEE